MSSHIFIFLLFHALLGVRGFGLTIFEYRSRVQDPATSAYEEVTLESRFMISVKKCRAAQLSFN